MSKPEFLTFICEQNGKRYRFLEGRELIEEISSEKLEPEKSEEDLLQMLTRESFGLLKSDGLAIIQVVQEMIEANNRRGK